MISFIDLHVITFKPIFEKYSLIKPTSDQQAIIFAINVFSSDEYETDVTAIGFKNSGFTIFL